MMAPEKSVAAKEESADAADLNRHQWGVKSTSGNYPWDTTPSPLGGRMKAAAQKLAGEIAPGPGPVPSGSATTPPPSLVMEPEQKNARPQPPPVGRQEHERQLPVGHDPPRRSAAA